MNVSVTKRFTFDAAHQLPKHDGKCRNLHGHTYHVDITISGSVQLSGPSEGMVIDFGKMRAHWNRYIVQDLDHRFLNETLQFTPTAEMLACWLVTQWSDWAESFGCKLDSVKVWETPTSYAEARP